MDSLALFVSAPIAAFRAPFAREYLETLPCPPPATLYGMLLSLVGEERRHTHAGAEIAVGLLSRPAVSVVLRTSWRLKGDEPLGTGANKRPDFQEILTDVRIAVWIRQGADAALRPLVDRVRAVVSREESPVRYGALALGESTHLVDEVRPLREEDGNRCNLLLLDPQGDLALPVWVDHVGSAGTRWGQYRLAGAALSLVPDENAWTRISPP